MTTRTPTRLPDEVPRGERGYPRPLLRRENWTSLDGTWDFAIDQAGTSCRPADVEFDRVIEVPYAPETKRSGVGYTAPFQACWYRRLWTPGRLEEDERLLLHFGAVDYAATVWLDGDVVVTHEGGHTPFSVDVTDRLRPGRKAVLVVRAGDDPTDLSKPRGKQDWLPEPHSIWYPRTSGIWQSVWCERVRETRITSLRWTTNLERWEVALEARVAGMRREGSSLTVKLRVGDRVIAEDSYSVNSGEVNRRIELSDPGIDDSRNLLLWSPESPTLIEAEIVLVTSRGEVLDKVRSYTALRSFRAKGRRLLLNGRPYPLRLVLDQGYWPDTGMTGPDDAAFRADVELTKAMGFNGARKHQKIEDPRYLYWADRLGLLVFEEMPSAYRFTNRSVNRLIREWLEVLERDASHPCIIAWVPLNESWGVPNLPDVTAEQNYVRALYHMTKTIDPERLVLGNDGWESVTTDIIGVHDYDSDPERLLRRYGNRETLQTLLAEERPGGRALIVGSGHSTEHPLLLSEFGGIALSNLSSSWGYSRQDSANALQSAYTKLLDTVHRLELFSGFCYTQFADTYQEANGLLNADRSPKFPLEQIRRATLGPGRIVGPGVVEPFEVP